MAHYAKVNQGLVTQIIVAEEDFFETFQDTSPGTWIQTSYNTRGGKHYQEDGTESSDQSKALRKNFAGIDFTYDTSKDAFISPKPYNSWTLNNTTCLWEAPVASPSDDGRYDWNETDQTWDAVE
jgi:hypothetical protein